MKKTLLVLLSLIALIGCTEKKWQKTTCPSAGKVNSIVINGMNIIAGTESCVFNSENNGKTWDTINKGLQTILKHKNSDKDSLIPYRIFTLAMKESNVYAGTDHGIYLFNSNEKKWLALNYDTNCYVKPINVYAMAIMDTNIFAGTDNGIFKLTYKKNSKWSVQQTSIDNLAVYSFAVGEKNIYAGTYGGIFKSSNNGLTWVRKNNGIVKDYLEPRSLSVHSIVVNGKSIYAGTANGVFKSKDEGENWVAMNKGLTEMKVLSLAVNNNNIYAGTECGGAFLYNDTIWKSMNDDNIQSAIVSSLAVNDSTVFLSSYNTIWNSPLTKICK